MLCSNVLLFCRFSRSSISCFESLVYPDPNWVPRCRHWQTLLMSSSRTACSQLGAQNTSVRLATTIVKGSALLGECLFTFVTRLFAFLCLFIANCLASAIFVFSSSCLLFACYSSLQCPSFFAFAFMLCFGLFFCFTVERINQSTKQGRKDKDKDQTRTRKERDEGRKGAACLNIRTSKSNFADLLPLP